MKQVININFQGRVVPIEVSAYEILKSYIDSLSRHFAGEDGKEEIINDIESRIGELFQERISKGSTCITDEDVNAIIRSMGRPEDFETEESASATNTGNSQQSSNEHANTQSSFAHQGSKRLYRSEDHKLIGGICGGLANYFNIDVVIVRVVALILFFSFGFGFLAYVILWIAVPSASTAQIGGFRKRLFRDNEDKYIGGVCSGLAHYFGINVWIPRILFLIPFLSFFRHWGDWGPFHSFPNFVSFGFSPGSFIIYVILWLVLPEASSTAEKLEMKGEKVDMNTIKNSVMEEMKGVQQRAEKFGKDAATFASQTGRTFSTEAAGVAKRGSRSLGDVIIFIVKLFGYIILGFVSIVLIVSLFGFGIAAISLFPMKDYFIEQGWQNAYAWGTLIFFIIVPMVGIITWIIRKLAKIKTGGKMLGLGFGAMWILGWFCVTMLATTVTKDFRHSSNFNEKNIMLTNPGIQSLEVTTNVPGQRMLNNRWFRVEAFDAIDEDTALLRNVEVEIIRSPNDSFKVTMSKIANGKTRAYADTLASLIHYNVYQQDSLLIADRGIQINKTDKFRNQRIILTIYVPVGKRIKINNNIGWYRGFHFGNHDEDWNDGSYENEEHGWGSGQWYVMQKDGLYAEDGLPADSYKRDEIERKNRKYDENGDYQGENNSGNGGAYRYDTSGDAKPTAIDSLKVKLQQEERRTKDSLQKAKEKIEKQLEKLGGAKDGVTAWNNYSIPGHDPILFLN